MDFLERNGVDALVVACNTASAMALEDLDVRTPHWGVLEPGASAAVAVAGRHVGVIAHRVDRPVRARTSTRSGG